MEQIGLAGFGTYEFSAQLCGSGRGRACMHVDDFCHVALTRVLGSHLARGQSGLEEAREALLSRLVPREGWL